MGVPFGIGAGILGVGAALAGGVMGTVAQLQQNKAQEQQLKYQAAVEEQNRRNHQAMANAEAEQGQWEKRNLALQQAAQLSKARASFGASGAALGSGSLLLYEEDAAVTNELDQRQMQYDIDGRVWQHKVGAWNAASQANAYRASAKNTKAQKGMLLGSGIASTIGSTLSAASAGVNLYNQTKDWNFNLFNKTNRPSSQWTVNTQTLRQKPL